MSFLANAGSNDGACAIWACISLNSILIKYGDRIIHITAEVTGMLEI